MIQIEQKIDMSSLPKNSTPSNDMPDATYGFIGVGAMGCGMALNVRAKIPMNSSFFVFDIDETKIKNLSERAERRVSVATSPKQIAEECVC